MNGWNSTFDSSTKSYEFSKITDRIRKKLFQSSRTYAVKWQFWTEISPSGFIDRFDKTTRTFAVKREKTPSGGYTPAH
jgi:hypothetical protein